MREWKKGHSKGVHLQYTDDRQELPVRGTMWPKLSPQKRLCHDCNVLKKSVREDVKWLTEELRGKKQKKRPEPGLNKQGCSPLCSVSFVLDKLAFLRKKGHLLF